MSSIATFETLQTFDLRLCISAATGGQGESISCRRAAGHSGQCQGISRRGYCEWGGGSSARCLHEVWLDEQTTIQCDLMPGHNGDHRGTDIHLVMHAQWTQLVARKKTVQR